MFFFKSLVLEFIWWLVVKGRKKWVENIFRMIVWRNNRLFKELILLDEDEEV